MRVIPTTGYERQVLRLLRPEARAAAEAAIVTRPDAWPVIPGTGGARKARVALPGRGKSGGVRMIYFVLVAAGAVYLLNIYAKNEKENLTDAEKNATRRLIAEIEAEAHSARPPAHRGS